MNICKTAVRGCIVQFVVDVEEVNQCFCSNTFQQLSDAAETSTSDVLVMGRPPYLQIHSRSLQLQRKIPP